MKEQNKDELAILNTEIQSSVLKRAKAKASLLDINLGEFVNRCLDINTQDISLEIKKPIKMKNGSQIKTSNSENSSKE